MRCLFVSMRKRAWLASCVKKLRGSAGASSHILPIEYTVAKPPKSRCRKTRRRRPEPLLATRPFDPRHLESMLETTIRLANNHDLRQFILETLSRFESLDPDQFPLDQRVLTRGGQPCGLYFCLHGPRAVRLTAIWEKDGNSILFYGADGRRLQRTRLLEPPALESCLNCAA